MSCVYSWILEEENEQLLFFYVLRHDLSTLMRCGVSDCEALVKVSNI